MRAELYIPDWIHSVDHVALPAINEVLGGVWAEAAGDYAAAWTASRLSNRRGPVGVQKFLNSVIDERFRDHNWTSYASTFTSDQVWFRITFRHQMSASANIIEAMKAVARYGYKAAVIAAATREFLEVISPADAASLTSFEKIQAELDDLKGIIELPILGAALHPSSIPSVTSRSALGDPRRKRNPVST